MAERMTDSNANRQVHEIRRLLRRARRGIIAWLREHTASCNCVYCTNAEGFADEVERDLRGIAWTLANADTTLGSYYPDPRQCRRDLIDAAREWGMLPKPDDGHADPQPAVVIEPEQRRPGGA